MSRVQIDPITRTGESFAHATASSSVSNGIAATTGPKISSRATRHALSTSASTHGRRKYAGAVRDLAPGDELRALLHADLDVVRGTSAAGPG